MPNKPPTYRYESFETGEVLVFGQDHSVGCDEPSSPRIEIAIVYGVDQIGFDILSIPEGTSDEEVANAMSEALRMMVEEGR